jgi:hypothetical protein
MAGDKLKRVCKKPITPAITAVSYPKSNPPKAATTDVFITNAVVPEAASFEIVGVVFITEFLKVVAG